VNIAIHSHVIFNEQAQFPNDAASKILCHRCDDEHGISFPAASGRALDRRRLLELVRHAGPQGISNRRSEVPDELTAFLLEAGRFCLVFIELRRALLSLP
jgi:hypothetical protein